jgi:hypothetical protein
VTPFSTLNALNVTVCDCEPITIEGYLSNTEKYDTQTPPSPSLSTTNVRNCTSTENINATIFSVSRVCPDVAYRIFSSYSIISLTLTNSLYCMSVSLSELTADALSKAVTASVSISFVESKTAEVTNSLSVVENNRGVIVGQLLSNLVIIEREFPTDEDNLQAIVNISVCLKELDTIEVDKRFTVTDIGQQSNTDNVVRPLGKRSIVENNFSTSLFCFYDMNLTEKQTKLMLIQRLQSYEDETLKTTAETAILYTTAVLYAIGVLLVLYLMLISATAHTLPGETILLWIQCGSLFGIRCVYFFLVANNAISPGSLGDYVMIEAPTFFYVCIFLQLLIPIMLFRNTRLSQQKSKKKMRFLIGISLLLVAFAFGMIVIAISQVNTATTEQRECEGRITTASSTSNATLIIRLVYKSLVLAIALCVVVLLWVFTLDTPLYTQQPTLFKQIIGIAFCLFFNCLAFVVYYSVNQSTPYFAIVLWFTELVPILLLSVVVGIPGGQLGRYTWAFFYMILSAFRDLFTHNE